MKISQIITIAILFIWVILNYSCQKGSNDKPEKVKVELQVGYLPSVSTTSTSIDFYFTPKVGTLFHKYIVSKPYFDSAFAVYMKMGDSLKMVDPKDSLYGVFLVNGINLTNTFYNKSGGLVYYYVKQ